jgi:hypothetical protein
MSSMLALVNLFMCIHGASHSFSRISLNSPPCLRMKGGKDSPCNGEDAIFGSTESIIPRYGWDQDREYVEVYVLVEGSKNSWGDSWQEHLKVKLSRYSLRISIMDLGGKNYELHLDGLYEEINTSPAKIQARHDCIYIKLEKVRAYIYVCDFLWDFA